jgi:hypothetical protein
MSYNTYYKTYYNCIYIYNNRSMHLTPFIPLSRVRGGLKPKLARI